MVPCRPLRLAALLGLAALLLAACQVSIFLPEPDVRLTAERIVTAEPGLLDTITVPARDTRWVEVQYREVATPNALMYFEVAGSAVEGSVRVEFYRSTAPLRLLVASTSSRRFATQLSRLGRFDETGADATAERSAIAVTWTCFGPCTARAYEAGTYLVKLENTSSTARSVSIYAYGLVPTDTNEPNDTPATATAVVLARAGDGASGAIEHAADVDSFRLDCTADFDDGMRLTLLSDFGPAIFLRADERSYGPGVETDPIACGSTVAVATNDGSAGPSRYSGYSLVADPAALFELDVVAQGLIGAAPTALGSVSVPANATRLVRLTFPSAAAALRYVEIGGVNVEHNVRLEVPVAGQMVGYSSRRDLFASSPTGLSLAAGAAGPEPMAIGVSWSCDGPCVASRYQSGPVVVRITNASFTTRTVQVYAYGTPEADLNEPNERVQEATPFVVTAEGDGPAGAIERLGDVDYFRLACGAGSGFADLRLTLVSSFRGDIVMRVPGGQEFGPDAPRVVPCDSVVAVYTRDGTAGASAASRYSIVVD